jgi:hypothetical protein
MPDLAILYEHPSWFLPLFAALERRGISHAALTTHAPFSPSASDLPAPVIFNRIAMSSFLRAASIRSSTPPHCSIIGAAPART